MRITGLLAQRRLALAEENRDRFSRILEVNTIRFKKGYIAEVDLIRIRLQFIDFQSQVLQSLQEGETARADLRQLLQLSPATQLELTTDLDYKRLDPDIARLRTVALDTRPDVRARRLTYAQREADLKLAKAYRIPDVSIGAGYSIQGPKGPDNPQQWGLNLGLPLPLFNRNQGGIMQAEVGVQSAEAELNRTLNQVENQVDIAYRNLIQSRRLVEAFLGGVLDDARSTLTIVERAYERGGATILDLLDAARTSRTIQQNFIEALFNYQRNVIQLESAVARKFPHDPNGRKRVRHTVEPNVGHSALTLCGESDSAVPDRLWPGRPTAPSECGDSPDKQVRGAASREPIPHRNHRRGFQPISSSAHPLRQSRIWRRSLFSHLLTVAGTCGGSAGPSRRSGEDRRHFACRGQSGYCAGLLGIRQRRLGSPVCHQSA